MEWYHYIEAFFAGAFLSNFVPHFVHGISGNKFPSIFSQPRGVGLSSPTLNIVWALINLLIGYTLLLISGANNAHPLSLLPIFTGIAAVGLWLSIRFQKKHKE